MSRSTQLDPPYPQHNKFYITTHMSTSQQRKLSSLKNKRFSEGGSLATVVHRDISHTRTRDNRDRDPHVRSTKKHDIIYSPYRTLESSQRKLSTIHRPIHLPSEDRSNASLRKTRTKSLESKLNFRLRVFSHARKATKEELKPQQMNSESSAIYEKLFRRRKYGVIGRQQSKEKTPPHQTLIKPRPMDSEEDEISRNYIQNEIFMFQNDQLEFGFDEQQPKRQTEQAKPEAHVPIPEVKSTDKKKAFRKNKYQHPDLETIEYEVSRGGTKPPTPPQNRTPSQLIMIRQPSSRGEPNPNTETIQSNR